MGEVVEELERLYNDFIGALIKARDSWSELQVRLLPVSQSEIEEGSIELQKAVAKFRRAQFTVMLPRLADYIRSQGGLEALLVPGKEELGGKGKKEKEEKEEPSGNEGTKREEKIKRRGGGDI